MHGDHESSPIRAVMAVDEERCVLRVAQRAHHLEHLAIGHVPGQDPCVLEAQRGAPRFIFILVERAQIDDRADA
jgi:hypothetical protein